MQLSCRNTDDIFQYDPILQSKIKQHKSTYKPYVALS